MCGIFAYLNYNCEQKQSAIIEKLINGLKRLEYRGYDSGGICIDDKERKFPEIYRTVGKIAKLEELVASHKRDTPIESHIGIAHTRWATHGEPCERNSHPQSSDKENTFVVVHNGIITNFDPLKKMLISKGCTFESDTDTEVIVKLAKYMYDKNPKISFRRLIGEVVNLLFGAFAMIVKSSVYPNECIALKKGSPLILGIKRAGEMGSGVMKVAPIVKSQSLSGTDASLSSLLGPNVVEYFLASDSSAIVEHTKNVVFLEDLDLVHFRANGDIGCYSCTHDDKEQAGEGIRQLHTLEMELEQISKGGFDHFMMKEIFEQPESIVNAMRGRLRFETNTVKLGGIANHLEDIRRSRRIIFIACGTSYHSSVATRSIVEELTLLPVILELASDFLDRRPPIFRSDACVFISQSGETADTLRALEYCKSRNALCLGVTNTVGSAIARGTDCGVHLNCGPEIGVASTKAYTSQILVIILMALKIGEDSIRTEERRKEVITHLHHIPTLFHQVLKGNEEISEIAKKFYQSKSLLIMGRGYQYSTCLEAALKIKELTYMHSEGVMSGELKHGPLALIDEKMPILFVCTKDGLYDKTINGLQQILARKANPIIVCHEGDNGIDEKYPTIRVPKTLDCLQSLVNIIPFQLLSYHIAVLRGLDVDQPRNLAKSVTVE